MKKKKTKKREEIGEVTTRFKLRTNVDTYPPLACCYLRKVNESFRKNKIVMIKRI